MTKGRTANAPIVRNSKLPKGIRRAKGTSDIVNIIGTIPAPMLAPSTKASPSASGTTPVAVRDMKSSTMATLEWASQVNSAARMTAKMGSLAKGSITTARASLSRKGTEAPTIKDRDKSIRPSPIITRPR